MERIKSFGRMIKVTFWWSSRYLRVAGV